MQIFTMISKMSCSKQQWIRPLLQSSCFSHSSQMSNRPNSSSDVSTTFEIDEEFEKIDVMPPTRDYFLNRKHTRTFGRETKPRTERMSTDQHWPDVWPGQRMFHPGTVPLPIHQGYVQTCTGMKPKPDRFFNTELMKIPNFLHLTPIAIKQQTNALKRFCSAWPKGLETDELCEQHFPVEVYTTDRVFASPSIRDPKARTVQVQVRLDRLQLDEHARQKMILLLGDRYDPTTDLITIQTDNCPFKKQNYDYAMYLLTATFFESWVRTNLFERPPFRFTFFI